MRKDCGIASLSVFYTVYFVYLGFSTFMSKYFAQIGLTESQIGILMSVPALFSMCFMPMWGALSDRVRLKKLLLAATIALSALALFFVDGVTNFAGADPATGELPNTATKFLPLLGLFIVNSFFGQSIMPTATSISLEYTASVGRTYGPIRMLGTVGYQIGALLIGFICVKSLRHLFTYQGAIMLASALLALTLPRVGGHQYGHTKVSPLKVLADKRIRLLLLMVLIAACTTMFYLTFFGAFLESMNVDNRIASIITWISVALEIPMLYFANAIMKKRTIWQWLIIGYVLNGIRWIGFAVAAHFDSWVLLLMFQIPAVTATACFEFFPSLYLGKVIAPELSSSAQTLLNLTSFGIAKTIGALLGGFVSQAIGIRTMYIFCGILLLCAAVVFYPASRKYSREENA